MRFGMAISGAGSGITFAVGEAPGNESGEPEDAAAAFGHPQTRCIFCASPLRSEYAGSAKFADVARQSRIEMGESMEISKWRRLSGFSGSGSALDMRRTI